MTPEEEQEFRRRRKGRNLAMLALLGAFVALIFAVTIVKLGGAGVVKPF